jgi:NADH-quinone oxidoreductase subunit H
VTPSPVQQELILTVVKVLVLFNALLGLFSVMTWAERRLLGFMQFRLGPNRTGPIGILQPVADGIKLFFKEEVIPAGANKGVFVAAPALAVFTAFLSIAVVPYGGTITLPRLGWLPGWLQGREVVLQIADLDVGILFIFAISSLGVYGIVLAGWAANNKYTLMGGLRSSAQMFSYELALGLSWVGVIMLAGSFRIRDIVGAQAGGLVHWNFIQQILGFAVYLVAATAEVNRTPFDLPEAETELVAGFHTEYSSMRFALLQMAEYVNMITVAAVGANLFFGGWLSPVSFLPDSPLWFFVKLFAGLFFFIWLRGTLPRLRYDQLMAFGWKVLVPLATLNILLTAAFVLFFPGLLAWWRR